MSTSVPKVIELRGRKPAVPTADAAVAVNAPPDAVNAAVARLFAAHRLALHRYLARMLYSGDEAEEVAQEAYVRLLRARNQELLADPEAARRFLFTVATNLARDRFRQRRAHFRDAHVPVELDELAGIQEAPEDIVDWNAGVRVIKQVLLDLPPRHRQVFLLHVMQGMSYRAIAVQLEVSAKTVERDIAMVLELCQSRLRTTSLP